MDKLSVLVLAILCAVALVSRVEALKCYVCNSKQDKRCLDPTNETSPLEPTDCAVDLRKKAETREAIRKITEVLQKLGTPQMSLSDSSKDPVETWEKREFPMACQKLEIKAAGEKVTGRGCSAPRMDFFDPCEAVRYIQSDDIVMESCSLCDSDGCNKGVIGKSVPVLLVTILVFLLLT